MGREFIEPLARFSLNDRTAGPCRVVANRKAGVPLRSVIAFVEDCVCLPFDVGGPENWRCWATPDLAKHYLGLAVKRDKVPEVLRFLRNVSVYTTGDHVPLGTTQLMSCVHLSPTMKRY